MNRPHSHRSQAGLAIIIVPLIALIAATIFAWPAARMEPRDLPIGLVGPPDAVSTVEPALASQGFDISTYDSEATARNAIGDRDVYGALVLGPDGAKLLTASAASPAVAQLLQQASTHLAVQSSQPPPVVEDIVPLPADDPRGAVLPASMLPLLMAGMAGGVLLSRLIPPGWTRLGAVVTLAALNGMVAAWITQSWLGALEGSWWTNAGVFMLMQLAIMGALTGAHALWGLPGLGGAAATMMLIGNPWSGITSAPELLPEWIATIGQLLPLGATGTLIRSTAFFGGAAGGGAVLVLLTWIVLGLGALAWAAWRQPETAPMAQLATR